MFTLVLKSWGVSLFRLAQALSAPIARLARAARHRRDLSLLAGLDERGLRDIGLTRGDVNDAISEPVWRDPTVVLRARSEERRQARRGPVRRACEHLAEAPPTAPEIDGPRASTPARYY